MKKEKKIDYKNVLAISGVAILAAIIIAALGNSATEGPNKMNYCFKDNCCSCSMYEGSAPPLSEIALDIFDLGCSCCACVNSTAHEIVQAKYGMSGCIHGFQDHCRQYQQDTGVDPQCFYGGRQ